jgi:hypothetical protein
VEREDATGAGILTWPPARPQDRSRICPLALGLRAPIACRERRPEQLSRLAEPLRLIGFARQPGHEAEELR